MLAIKAFHDPFSAALFGVHLIGVWLVLPIKAHGVAEDSEQEP